MKSQKDTNAATAANTEKVGAWTKPVTVGLITTAIQVNPDGSIRFSVSARNKLRGTGSQKRIDDVLQATRKMFELFVTGDYELRKIKKGRKS